MPDRNTCVESRMGTSCMGLGSKRYTTHTPDKTLNNKITRAVEDSINNRTRGISFYCAMQPSLTLDSIFF